MTDLIALTIVPTEADLICAVLRTAGVEAFQRQSNVGAGSADGMPQTGTHEVIVSTDDLGRAHSILEAQP
jgi:hypothetical protein